MLTMPSVTEIQTAAEKNKQEEVLALVTNLACYLGKLNPKRLVYAWDHKGLFVVVNKERRYTIAIYQHKVVLSNFIPDDLIYIEGYWIDIVHELHNQIRQSSAAKEREVMFDPLVEV